MEHLSPHEAKNGQARRGHGVIRNSASARFLNEIVYSTLVANGRNVAVICDLKQETTTSDL